MIRPPLAAALVAARRLALPVAAEEVPLHQLLGRTLARDVLARADLPTADSSIMDGWAVRSADMPRAVQVVGESRAGAPFAGRVGAGEAVRISTGALVPEGADAVLRLEDGAEHEGELRPNAGPGPGHDVRPGGEDLRRGEAVLRVGARINGVRVGAVAAAGHASAVCRVRPAVALVTTGSELVEPGEPVGPGTVFNANHHGLRGQVIEAGADVAYEATVGDDRSRVRTALGQALEASELMVVVGGLSVGRHDHVRAALDELGLRPAVTRLAMRPGRPTVLGTVGDRRVLALPGNPGAAATGVHLLGRALLGTEVPWQLMPLATAMESAARLDEIVRCRVASGRAEPFPVQASGSISALADADVLAWLPWGRTRFSAGDLVQVSCL